LRQLVEIEVTNEGDAVHFFSFLLLCRRCFSFLLSCQLSLFVSPLFLLSSASFSPPFYFLSFFLQPAAAVVKGEKI
jgi:hypothetical protein